MQRWKSKVYKLHNVSAIYESAATQKGDFNLLCIVLRCKNFMSTSMTFIAVTRLTLDCEARNPL